MIKNAFNSRKNVGAVVDSSWRAVLICSRQPGEEAQDTPLAPTSFFWDVKHYIYSNASELMLLNWLVLILD